MRKIVRRSLMIMIAVALWAVAVVDSGRADEVSVRVGSHQGYGRIVFNWPAPVAYTARVQNRQIIVDFQRPVETSFAALPGALNKYIRRPRLSANGRRVVIPLADTFEIRSFDLGHAIIVDVMDKVRPASAAATQPPPPAPKPQVAPPSSPQAPVSTPAPSQIPVEAARKSGPPAVPVRSGEQDGFTRLVFEWPNEVPYVVRKTEDGVSITFEQLADLDLEQVKPDQLELVRELKVSQTGNELSLALSIPPTAGIRHFRSGATVVLDILKPAGADQQTAQAPSPQPSGQLPPPIALPGVTTPTGQSEGGAPVPLTPGQSAGAAGSAPASDQNAEPSQEIQAVTLTVEWTEPVAAAVFRRAGNLWIIFDKQKQLDTASLKAAGRGALKDVQQVASETGSILLISSVSGVNPSLRRDGFNWIFDFKQQPLQPQTTIDVQPQPNSPVGPRLFLPVAEAGAAMPFRDPTVGDNLVVIPVIPLAHGVAERHRYAQMDVLPSGQGVVIRPKIDALRVRPIPQGIEISSTARLALTSTSPRIEAQAKIGSFQSLSRVFPPSAWRRGRRVDVSQLNQNRNELLRQIASAKSEARRRARMELAIFHLGNSYAPETLGVLRQIAADNPESTSDPQFLLLRGAANFKLKRYDEAREDLSHASLTGNDEGEFWRAIVTSASGDPESAAPVLKRVGGIFRPYPHALKVPIGMRITEAAIAVGDVRMGTTYLEALAEEEPTPREVDQLANIEGKLKQLAGDFEGAVAAWEAAENGENRRAQAEATLARAELLLQLGKISRAEAIEELESLRFAWRGDDFEFNLLRKLGRMYLQTDDFRNGLRTLRQAVTYFREEEDSKLVAQEMADAFIDLYLKDAADTMTPVQAIALYEEFKELTPGGEQGDEMIRKLADRLAAVDLLGRAATLLSQQVEFRLKGVLKARVAARLATIYLLDRQPKKAEEILKSSNTPAAPEALRIQRRHLLATAQVDQGRLPAALATLEDDDSKEADVIRADIFVQNREWANATRVLQRLVRAFGAKPNEDLTTEQAKYILQLATAFTLSGNERGLTRLRADYGVGMAKTQIGEAFNLVASPNAIGLVDYRLITEKVKEVSGFGTFLAAYRERVKSGELSQLN